LIARAAEKMKEMAELRPPSWLAFAKSGPSRQRIPQQKDFWYLRCASILRKIYIGGSKGVSRLRTAYGSKKRRGVRRKLFAKAGGSIIRKALQQLEKAGFLTKAKKGGRTLTAKGRAFLDAVARESKKRVKRWGSGAVIASAMSVEPAK